MYFEAFVLLNDDVLRPNVSDRGFPGVVEDDFIVLHVFGFKLFVLLIDAEERQFVEYEYDLFKKLEHHQRGLLPYLLLPNNFKIP